MSDDEIIRWSIGYVHVLPPAGVRYSMMQIGGVWRARFERLPDGSLEPITDDDWRAHDWIDITEQSDDNRVYRRGRKLVDPDDF